MEIHKLVVTTDASGDGTDTADYTVAGFVLTVGLDYAATAAAGTDVTLSIYTPDGPARTLLAVTNNNTDGWYLITNPEIPVSGYLRMVVAQGGNAVTDCVAAHFYMLDEVVNAMRLVANSGVDIGDVTVNNAADAGVYVRPGSGATFPVSGTFYQGTQPVSVAAYTTPTHTAVNVTTSSGAVLAANANRKYALLVNDSDTTIYIKLNAAAVVNQGIRLNANGGSYEMSTLFGNLYTGAINGIHGGSGNKALTMTEGV